MLAYVFWHWRTASVERAEYEASLLDFQRALERAAPRGWLRAAVYRIDPPLPAWLPCGAGDAYEEWHLLEGSGALDRLNDAAVAGDCRAPHDRAARSAAGGLAGLYRLRAGHEALPPIRHATWFGKPPGLDYDELFAHVSSAMRAPEGEALWGRQMVLGPGPELCRSGPRATAPPLAALAVSPLQVELRRVWPPESV